MNIAHSKRVAVYAFLDDGSRNHKTEKGAFRKSLRMSGPMYAAIKKEWEADRGVSVGRPESVIQAQNRIQVELEGFLVEGGEVVPGINQYLDKNGNFDIKKAVQLHMKDIFEGLKKSAGAGNAQAGKILLQLNGMLEDKAPVEVSLDVGAVIFKAVRERPEMASRGVVALPRGLRVLRPDLCEDSGQGEEGDD